MTDFPRDDLFRMVELTPAEVEFRAEDDGDHIGVLTGYAAVFNSDTIINSWEGRFVERLAPGAFTKTLAERGDKVKVLFNHGFDPSIGDKPLGKPRLHEERSKGLYVEVPLDDTSYNRDLVASIRSGALDGMSFRFSVVKEEVDESGDMPVRTVRELKLYEYGPVTFPAYEATTVGVRSRSQYEVWRNSRNEISPADEAESSSLTSEEATDQPLEALDSGKERNKRSKLWVVRLKDVEAPYDNPLGRTE